MKIFFKSAWIIFSIVLLLLFVISCFSPAIAPLTFSYITFFALAFPYLFLLTLIVAIINFYINKRLTIVMLICLPPGIFNLSHTIAFNFPKKFNDKKDSATLRVMTWNVQDFVNLSPQNEIRLKMLHIITQKNPDVLCVQEYTNVEGGRWRISVCKELDSLGFKYHFFSADQVTTNHFDAVVTRGSAIFSKMPFTDSGRILIRNDGTTEYLAYANINFDNRLVRIYTAHLASYELYRDTDNAKKDVYQITYERKRTIQYKLREIEQLHQKEATIIDSAVSRAVLPIIYCGDMNSTPCTYTYHLIKNDFKDAFLEKGSGIGATFYKVLPMLRIDYCLADKRLKVINCTVINQKLSDHYPVVTDLQWK
jgi:endonuclease/exonuclease/phosphatase family metal-dependent hydrolase